MKTIFFVLAVFMTFSCKSTQMIEQEGSELRGYRDSSFSSDPNLGKQAVEALQENGWCDLPAGYLSGFGSHEELITEMACIANSESTFNPAALGPKVPSIDNCGRGVAQAAGFWQIMPGCHKGRSVRDRYGNVYSCGTNLADINTSAQCALMVYVEAVDQRRGNGIGPWEGKCKVSRSHFSKHAACREPCLNATATWNSGSNEIVFAKGDYCPASKVRITKLSDNTPVCLNDSGDCEFIFENDRWRSNIGKNSGAASLGSSQTSEAYEVKFMFNDKVFRTIKVQTTPQSSSSE